MKKRGIIIAEHSANVSESYGFLKSNYNGYICANDRTSKYIANVAYMGKNFSMNAFYTYDARGNISSVTDNGNNYSYEYDGLNRLTRENNDLIYFTKLYEYDGNGNIVTVKEYNYTTGTSFNNERVTTYTYDTWIHKDRLLQVTKVLTATQAVMESFTVSNYDGIGNACNYRGNVLKWERGRNLTEYGSHKYRYNAAGIRQEKETAAGVLHKYYTEGNRIHKEIRGNNTLWYLYDATGITGIDYNGERYYFQKNIQGDVVRITDYTGALAASYVYDAWGNHIVMAAGGNITSSATHIGNINPFRYRGYYYDAETNFYYLNSRYYDPQIGRFINADDINVAGTYAHTLNGLNLYSYCLNNPVMNTDPSGRVVTAGVIIGLIIAIIGFLFATNALIHSIMAYMRNPSGMNLFGLIVSAIFWVISLVSLVFAVVHLVQAVRTVGALTSASLATQGADDAVAGTVKETAKAGQAEKVFWSGGKEAEGAARTFAEKTGRTTLEMTKEGKNLIDMGDKATRVMWKEASNKFAQSAIGNQSNAHVFINQSLLRADSIWITVERPLLLDMGIQIITHII
jgi:RHS repeat-associated protein